MSSKRFIQKQLINRPFKLFPKRRISRTFSKKFYPEDSSTFNIFSIYNFKFRFISRPTFLVIRSSQYGFISDKSIESFRKIISPFFKKRRNNNNLSIFFIRSFPYIPLTKKPSEVRMGGGKGSKLRGWVTPVYPGKILFEIFFINKDISIKIISKARKKLGINTTIVFRLSFLKMTFIQIQSVLPVVDNSGVKSIRCIKICGRPSTVGKPGNFIVGSIFKVKPRLKFRSGHIYRAVIIQSRFLNFRKCGSFMRSLCNRTILIKKGEDVPIANRTKTYFFLELRVKILFKVTMLTIFLALKLI